MKNLLLLSALLSFAFSKDKNELIKIENGEQLSIDFDLINTYITCWGDSLTSEGGWTTIVSQNFFIFNQ